MLAPLCTHHEEEPLHDSEELIELLDSLACNEDLRVVFTLNHYSIPLRPRMAEFLEHNATCIELPQLRERADELAAVIVDMVTRIDPQVACHARLLEHFLVERCAMNEIERGLIDAVRVPNRTGSAADRSCCAEGTPVGAPGSPGECR